MKLPTILRLALGLLSLLLLMAAPAPALAQSAGTSFDHTSTGFPLRARHEDVRCETCHQRGIFKGTPRDCAGCHVQNNTRGALAMPARHIQTNAACDTCHTQEGFSGARFSHFGVAPGGCASCHNGQRVVGKSHGHPPTSAACDQCHSTTSFQGAARKPDNHIPYAVTAACSDCHRNPNFAVVPPLANIHAYAPSGSSNCAQCHGAAAATFAIPSSGFAVVGMPGNHIPTTAPCELCHVGPGSSMAALPVGNGAKFSGSLMNHSGIGSNCVACHVPAGTSASFAGISRIVGMPPTSPAGSNSHIPSSTTCESCHLASMPAAPVPASATKSVPGTGFASPPPSGAQIHAGVTSGCNSCHDTSMVWVGMGAYPITPGTLVPGAQYNGFQTRPRAAAGAFNVADPAHPISGDCSQCHGSTTAFSGVDKPANHIPYAVTAQCNSCHTASDYAVMPTLANIHAYAPSINTNCAQCHGAAAASFAIPAANFSIVGKPADHLPTAASCEVCHVGPGSSVAATPVGDGAKFSRSLMNHSGISSNCAACHVPAGTTVSFAGVGRIVGMPPTSPAGAGSHIPSSTTCENCHLASMPVGGVAPNATATAPGTGFATPAPTGVQIHNGLTGGVSSGCNSCHEAGMVWMGVGAYPISPSTLTTGAQYKGFQTRPVAAGGIFSVADPAHPTAGDCAQCHGSTTAFTGVDKPANHIPFAANAACNNCHTGTDYRVMPTLTAIHAYAPSSTGNCAQCHGAAAASFAIPANNFAVVGMPTNHIPTTAACETCHVGPGSSIAAMPVVDGAKFSGSLMNHAGISGNCVSCHVPASSNATFAGISRLIGMPPTSPAGASSHIPSSTTCESCHQASMPVGLIPASATKPVPGSGFATPAPTGVQIHNGVTSGCSGCHDSSMVWMGMSAYPISPSVLTAGGQYKGFQTRPRATAGTFNVADPAHPVAGDCSQCHGNTTVFTGIDKPANHIPYAATATCDNCHKGTNYAVLPSLADIHAYAPSTTTNCTQCHGAAAPSFAIPAIGFAIVGLPNNHIPTTESCEVCHVGAGSSMAALPVGNGAKFSGSLMSHTRITSNCVACHTPASSSATFAGISRIVGMPATSPAGASSHIPSSTTCESCHLGSVPSGLIPASATKTAPGTGFATPAPTGVQIHNGVTGGCAACHDTGMVWMGVSAYPISPSTLTPGAQYKGFQTRPRAAGSTYSVADAGHPASGDCSLCHSNTTAFSGVNPPSNHIPYAAAATCIACHTDTNYAVMPTLANIHANAQSTTANCAQCHSAAAAAQYAIPAANFSIVGLPTNGTHIPATASCEVCHVGPGSSVSVLPVGNGAKFSGSLMSHSGITSNCVACHVTSSTVPAPYTGIARIVGMPPTSPVGVNSHIPSSSVCEACHSATSVPGLIPASATKTAPGTLFATPVPTGVQIHSGITSGCNACHDTGRVWMGMGAYPITPSTMTPGAQYKGFQTRPTAAASTYSVADAGHPATGDCSACHTGTAYFDGAVKPAGHIPTNGSCSTCHVKSGDFTIIGLGTNVQLHTGITNNCRSCHAGGPYAGSGQVPGSTLCATTALPYVPKPMPLSACGASPMTSSALNHIPVGTQACELCHSRTNFTTFKMAMTAMKPGTTSGPVSGLLMHTAGVPVASFPCMSCHEARYTWFGGTVMTRDKGSHEGTAELTHDCGECHTLKSNFSRMMRVRPVMRAAVNAALPRLLPRDVMLPGTQAAAGRFDHRGVIVGQCQTCHNGQLARGRPARHFGNRLSCDSCHRSSAWTPAQFSHSANVAGQCAACHNGVDASGRPGPHFVTVRSCDSCHRPLAWQPVRYPHLSPAYQPLPDRMTCISCHITNGEIIPRQLHGNPRLRPVPVPVKPGP